VPMSNIKTPPNTSPSFIPILLLIGDLSHYGLYHI
jgi:hypothetical protein